MLFEHKEDVLVVADRVTMEDMWTLDSACSHHYGSGSRPTRPKLVER